MELYGRVRHAVRIEGLSHREAARLVRREAAYRRPGRGRSSDPRRTRRTTPARSRRARTAGQWRAAGDRDRSSSSSDQGSTIEGFGQKIPLHDKLADLGMQLRHLGVAVLLAGTALLVEALGKLLHRFPLRRRYLRRMKFVLDRQLRDRPLPLIASSATLALNSDENRLRVLMVDHPFLSANLP